MSEWVQSTTKMDLHMCLLPLMNTLRACNAMDGGSTMEGSDCMHKENASHASRGT